MRSAPPNYGPFSSEQTALQGVTEANTESERQLEAEAALAVMKKTAREVAKAWNSPKGGVEILDEQRR